MRLNVIDQSALLTKVFGADVAGEWLFTGMDFDMIGQRGYLAKSLIAVFALVGSA